MILEKLLGTNKKYGLIKKGDKILIGVSGGPDSVCLLYLLYGLRKELGLSLHIAHFDHGLRRESIDDRKYVESLGKKLGIPVTWAKMNALKRRSSIEEAARDARFTFMCKLAKTTKAGKVALGHNLDDQAETVLMRIMKGTGLYGLSGILPKRKLFGVTFIRPLIEVKREDIEKFLKKKRITPQRDQTNRDEAFTRNKIRHRLLPMLEKEYSKNIKELLFNLGESAGYDYDYLKQSAKRLIIKPANKVGLKRFLKMHRSMQRLLLRSIIAKLKGDTRRITFQHIKEIEDLALNRPINSIVSLPRGIEVKKTAKFLQLYLRKQ